MTLTPLQRLDHALQLDPRLHGYQIQAVQHLHENPRAGLFLEMGLGKTASVLQALTDVHLPALVIAPKRVAENVWQAERDIWRPDLSIAIAAGSPQKRKEALASGADIVVLGRDNLKDVPKKHGFTTVVLDELSSFKSRQSQRWKMAKAITETVTYVWGLTGTPSPNGLLDLWPQMFLLDRGERLGKFITHYRNRYFRPGRQLATGVVIEWHLRPQAEENIHRLLADICLSMRSEGLLDLPPVTKNIIEVPLPSATIKVYEHMRETLVARLSDDSVHTAANAAVLTGKLSQITAGFLYPDEGEDEHTTRLHDEKTKAVVEVVEGTGSPVLVFYRFREELDRLKDALPQAEQIDAPDAIDRWNRGEIPVLLAHPASAGHGLNLQHGGHTIVWATMPWSLEEYEQGNARVARQGQAHPVVIHFLLSPSTIDVAIYHRLAEKKSVQDALMEALA